MLIYSIAVLLFLALQNSSGFKTRYSDVANCDGSYALRKQFLHEHNKRRALFAGGRKGLPGAANMHFMAYDCGLEKEAAELTKGCQKFPTQFNGNRANVASFEWQGNGVISVAKKAVSKWWNRKKQWDNSQEITGINSTMPFFLIANAVTDKVGCSVKECPYSHYTVACKYGKEAEVGHKLYEEGTACKACPGKNCYQKLCKYNATTSVQ